MSCDKYARMIIKQGSGVPTIPASSDHRNGDWIATDIYDGELYLDIATGIIYTSNGGVIQKAGKMSDNFANADLTLNGTRTHDLNGNILFISEASKEYLSMGTGTAELGYINSPGTEDRVQVGTGSISFDIGGTPQMSITSGNDVQIFNPNVYLAAIPTYANEAAAVTGGLTTGAVYMTATGELRIKL